MFVTVHPSSLLRVPDEKDKQAAYAQFVKDLRIVGELAAAKPQAAPARAAAR
jgi:hypothetical protein